jgi:prepilin-type N-terminal cleavage/methylation domain-containing protein
MQNVEIRDRRSEIRGQRPVRHSLGGSGSEVTDRKLGSGRQRRGFTLLEILVVISIIAILAGLVVPTFYFAKKRARAATAQTEVKHLETAFKSYLDTYKVWLFSSSIDEETIYDVADSKGLNLFSMLSGSDTATDLNPQRIVFYEFKSTTNYPSQTTAYDPWSNPADVPNQKPYHVMFDKNYDNKIKLPASLGGQVVNRSVVVWAEGDRGDPDYPNNYVGSWK